MARNSPDLSLRGPAGLLAGRSSEKVECKKRVIQHLCFVHVAELRRATQTACAGQATESFALQGSLLPSCSERLPGASFSRLASKALAEVARIRHAHSVRCCVCMNFLKPEMSKQMPIARFGHILKTLDFQTGLPTRAAKIPNCTLCRWACISTIPSSRESLSPGWLLPKPMRPPNGRDDFFFSPFHGEDQ